MMHAVGLYAAGIFFICASTASASVEPVGNALGASDSAELQINDVKCDSGCNTRFQPVCGADGITYTNRCIAACQEIAVMQEGICGSNDGEAAVASAWHNEEGQITKEIMARFESEGFTFQGYHHTGSGAIPTDAEELTAKVMEPPRIGHMPAASTAQQSDGVFGMRITREGFVYAQSAARSNRKLLDSGSDETIPGSPPRNTVLPIGAASGGRRLRGNADEEHRKLLTFGEDDRMHVLDATQYPYSAVGRFVYAMPGVDGYFICTATVISQTAILTAGQCVGGEGRYYSVFNFSPGLNTVLDSTGDPISLLRPFGRWGNWTSVTTYNQWLAATPDPVWGYKNGDFNWDMAVVTYEKGGLLNDAYLGDAVGHFGVGTSCTPPPLETTGYPGDIGAPFETIGQYHQGSCPHSLPFSSGCGYSVDIFDCDVYGGQPGSPRYDSENVVYGLVNFGATKKRTEVVPDSADASTFPSKYFNGGVHINSRKLKDIKMWAGGL